MGNDFGFVFLAASGLVASCRPEKILPVVIVQMIPAGLRGALIAALLAASCRRSVRPSMRGVHGGARHGTAAKPDLSVKALVRISYVATVSDRCRGHCHRNPSRKHQEHLGVDACRVIGATLIPNVLRWHWWRFNGWGYAAGSSGGLGAATLFGIGQTFHWFPRPRPSRIVTRHHLAGEAWRGVCRVAADARDPDCGIGDVLYARPAFRLLATRSGHCAAAPQIRFAAHGGHQCRCGGLCAESPLSSGIFLIGHIFLLRHRDRRRPAVWHHPLSLLVQVIAHHVCGAMIAAERL